MMLLELPSLSIVGEQQIEGLPTAVKTFENLPGTFFIATKQVTKGAWGANETADFGIRIFSQGN